MLGKLFGYMLTRGATPELLLAWAKKTPDEHIPSATNPDAIYMERYWLFNKITDRKRKYRWIPFSIRMHVIHEPDNDRHYHDHPFDALSCVLRGGYTETRLEWQYPDYEHLPVAEMDVDNERLVAITRHVVPGQWIKLGFEKYHRITALTKGPSISFFVFGDYLGMWGFLVRGVKMPHRVYREQFERK